MHMQNIMLGGIYLSCLSIFLLISCTFAAGYIYAARFKLFLQAYFFILREELWAGVRMQIRFIHCTLQIWIYGASDYTVYWKWRAAPSFEREKEILQFLISYIKENNAIMRDIQCVCVIRRDIVSYIVFCNWCRSGSDFCAEFSWTLRKIREEGLIIIKSRLQWRSCLYHSDSRDAAAL